MARIKSEEKRQAILNATAEAVADRGLAASTSSIARAAGVAEGSLFTYFADKDVLFNALYLSIKHELHAWLSEGYPSQAPIAERFAYVWARYIAWGADRTTQRVAMNHLSVSEKITAQTRAEGNDLFRNIGELFDVGVAEGIIRQQPPGFIGGIVTALAETTLAFMHLAPASAADYQKAGFETLWRALAAD